jgi:hypothetical protein
MASSFIPVLSFFHPPLSAGTKPPAKKYAYPSDLPHSVRVCAQAPLEMATEKAVDAAAITYFINVLLPA